MYELGDDYLTAREVAKHLRIGVRTVWRWTAAGKLPRPIHWSSRIVRWRGTDIRKMISSRESEAPAPAPTAAKAT